MKKKLPPFLAGMLTAALIGSLGVGALAATGQLTITVDPINIQVNGETFQPKDAQGADVPVFAYNGTTYAPLRALAEAYGLEVGYDAQNNMATVGAKAGNDVQPTTTPAPDTTASAADYSDWTAEEEAAYQEFKGMWEIELDEKYDGYGPAVPKGSKRAVYYLSSENPISLNDRSSAYTNTIFSQYCLRLGNELIANTDCDMVSLAFSNGWGVITIHRDKVIGNDVQPTTTPAPDTTASAADYSDWTAEEEAAYQEFKGMWEIEEDYYLTATYNGNLSEADFKTWWNGLAKESKSQYEAFCCRMVVELNPYTDQGTNLNFYYNDKFINQASVYADGSTHCYLREID